MLSGEDHARRWLGERGWDGVGKRFGRVRLIHEAGRIHGLLRRRGPSVTRAVRDGRLEFRYREPNVAAKATSVIDGSRAFDGEWRPENGAEWSPWRGRRLEAETASPGSSCWKRIGTRSLAESEYAFGHMLREVFARCRTFACASGSFTTPKVSSMVPQLLYLPDPAILIIASHGRARA